MPPSLLPLAHRVKAVRWRAGIASLGMAALAACGDGGPEPDAGSRIAFTIRLPQDSMDLVTVAEDGSDLRVLLSGAGGRYTPRWSPDGSEIAYLLVRSDRLDSVEVRIVRADGSGDRRVIGPGEYWPGVDWSPDGARLVIGEQQADGSVRLATVATDGSALTWLTQGSWDQSPSWSPTGEYIAFSRNCRACGDQEFVSDLWIMRADGSMQRQITQGTGIEDDSYAGGWSPDGTLLAYSSGGSGGSIHVTRPDGSGARQVVPDEPGEGNYSPVFSPDGGRILFLTGWGPTRDERGFRMVNVDGSGLADFPVGDFEPVSPDWR